MALARWLLRAGPRPDAMCPFCRQMKELTTQGCRVCSNQFPICSDCLWAVNDVCGSCGKVKCLDCRRLKGACTRTVDVAREGGWGQVALNTFQMPRVEVGVMTWNINHFENLPIEKTKAIHRLFELHPWLDVLVLQEINASATLDVSGGDLVMEKGPKITSLSVGKEPKSSKAKTFWDDDVKRWITPRQQEYYPIIFRASTAQYVRSSALSHKSGGDESGLCWTKSKVLQKKYAPCRPIVVHTFLVQGQPVNIAVVHTTPVGEGLGRRGEYLQVLPMLEYVSKAEGFWIVAGDYYLDPEATTQSNTDVLNRQTEELFRTKIGELGLSFAISVSATNQSKLQHDLPVIRDRLKRVIDGEEAVVLNKRADFFIYGPGFVRAEAGVVSPRGGLLEVDPDHHALNWWRQTSDHAPIGAILSSTQRCARLDELSDEKWLQPGIIEKAQAQLGNLYREAARIAAEAVKEMVNLTLGFPHTSLTMSPLARRFCCLVAEVSYTWGDWVAPWVDTITLWKEQTRSITNRQALQFADKYLQMTEKEISTLAGSHEVRAEMIRAIRQARYALFTLDLDCVDIDITDEDDDYSDVNLLI